MKFNVSMYCMRNPGKLPGFRDPYNNTTTRSSTWFFFSRFSLCCMMYCCIFVCFFIFLQKTCFGWHLGMYRGFETLTECIKVFIHRMVHTLYASYIVWFYIVWRILSRIAWRSLPYIVWWRASWAASSDVPRNRPKEPPPQTYIETDQKSHGSPRAKNRQNHNQK